VFIWPMSLCFCNAKAVTNMNANITRLLMVVAKVGSTFFKPSLAMIVIMAAVMADSKP